MLAKIGSVLIATIIMVAPSLSTPLPRPQLYPTPDNEPEPAVISKRQGDLKQDGTIGLNVFTSPLGGVYSGIGSINPYSYGLGSIGTAYGVNQLNTPGGLGAGGYYGAAAGLGGLGGGLGGLGGGFGGLGGGFGGLGGGVGALGPAGFGGLNGLGGLGGLGGYPLGGGAGGGLGLLGGGLYSPYGMYGLGNQLGGLGGLGQAGYPLGGGVVGNENQVDVGVPRNPVPGLSGVAPLPTSSTFFNQRFPSPLEVSTKRILDSVGIYLQTRLPRLVDRLVFYERNEED